jgi:hypothetical protein
MRPNKLRELLRAGRPSLGTHILFEWFKREGETMRKILEGG